MGLDAAPLLQYLSCLVHPPVSSEQSGFGLDAIPLFHLSSYTWILMHSPVASEQLGPDAPPCFDGAPADLRFAAAVATFAQILRGAPEVGGVSADAVREWALLAKGDDPGGLREGFVQLVERWIDTQRPGEER